MWLALLSAERSLGQLAAMDAPADKSDADGDLRKKIMAIQLDKSLTDAQKAQKRQELMASRWTVAQADESSDEEEDAGALRSLLLLGGPWVPTCTSVLL